MFLSLGPDVLRFWTRWVSLSKLNVSAVLRTGSDLVPVLSRVKAQRV